MVCFDANRSIFILSFLSIFPLSDAVHICYQPFTVGYTGEGLELESNSLLTRLNGVD